MSFFFHAICPFAEWITEQASGSLKQREFRKYASVMNTTILQLEMLSNVFIFLGNGLPLREVCEGSFPARKAKSVVIASQNDVVFIVMTQLINKPQLWTDSSLV